MVVWMGLAMMVSTRLWLASTVSLTRDRALADRLLQQVRRCGQAVKALLVCTDGWSAYVGSIKRAFREKVKQTKGRGRARLCIWAELHIATVIKRTQKKRVVEVTRRMSYGSQEQAERLLHYKIVPAPWVEPKRRGRPKKLPQPPAPTAEQPRIRALVRLRKGVLCSTTG